MKKILLFLSFFAFTLSVTAQSLTWEQMYRASLKKDGNGNFVQQVVAPNGALVSVDMSRYTIPQLQAMQYRKLPNGTYAIVFAGGSGGTGLAPIANSTLLGNVSGATGLPVALTPADVKTMLNITTDEVTTSIPITVGGVLYATGTRVQTILAALNSVINKTFDVITPTTYTNLAAQTTATLNGQVTKNTTTGDIVMKDLNGDVTTILGVSASNFWGVLGNAGTVQGTNFAGTTDNVGYDVRTNNLTRLSVMADGRIGVGTTNPQAKLHILGNGSSAVVPLAGNGMIISEGGGGGARIYLEHSGALTTTKVMLLENTSGVTKFSSLSDNAGAFNKQNILTMNHVNGNVGVGTQTAQNKLDVVTGVANTSGLRLTNLTSASPTVTGGAIGVDANGDVVRIAAAVTTTTNTLTGNTASGIVSTVNGTVATLTPPTGVVATQLGFDATGAIVKQVAPVLTGYVSDAAAAAAGVPINSPYFVLVGNTYGMTEGAMKVRRN